MPRRSLLTPQERAALVAIPTSHEDLIRHYTFSETDRSAIWQRRGSHNRLGFAVGLCYLRYPGFALPPEADPPERLLAYVAGQLRLEAGLWRRYAVRDQTRREHLAELQAWLGLKPFGLAHYRHLVDRLSELAQQTDRPFVLAGTLVEVLRHERVLLPGVDVIERICAEALTRGERRVYEVLSTPLSAEHRQALDDVLQLRESSRVSHLAWLRQPPGPPNAKHILLHIERLRALEGLRLPAGLEGAVHKNRLMRLAREGAQMSAQHLRELETSRRYATLVALVLDTRATLLDETIDLHDRLVGALFSRARRSHAERFHQAGKAVNDKVRLFGRIGRILLEARRTGEDPFAAIEAVMSWEVFSESVSEAESLAQPADFDYLPLILEGYSQVRRYAPSLLEVLQMKAAPAAREILEAVKTLRRMNERQARKVPEEAPTGFVRKRWEDLVFTETGVDRRFYELCVLSELKNGLRSGDISVTGSRQFRDFDDYLLPVTRFVRLRETQELGLAVETDCDSYLEARLSVLAREMEAVELLAAANELPEATITDRGQLKITPIAGAVPEAAMVLMRQAYSLLPHLKITELLWEGDGWTNFTRHFRHLKSGAAPEDVPLLLSALLADGINLGLRKMAECSPGTSYARLTWLQAWHVREETYAAALAELVNAQFRQPFAVWWGDGTTSSSDGQYFRAGGRGNAVGQVNLRYGQEPGVQFYTHLSDQYAPFHSRVINATVRDATYVLDGLLYHESDLRIEEHYTDTAGFTDHVFALMHLLGYRFAPRIRDLADKRLYLHGEAKPYPTLSGLIGGRVAVKHIRSHWDEILRLASSIKHGTVTASLMLRKLGSYPRQNGLAVALRELGRIERTLFTLDWLQHVELRRRVQIGLNKGEARNALARAVFLGRLGELRDRRFENQRYRASGLNLVVAAIVLWNTVYLERAVEALRAAGQDVSDPLLSHLSPLGWEHINLTGDYVWRQNKEVERGGFRPLRAPEEPQ